MHKALALLLSLPLLLGACLNSGNTEYHGVSPQVWQKLTLEQRQLIIDSALRDDLNPEILNDDEVR